VRSPTNHTDGVSRRHEDARDQRIPDSMVRLDDAPRSSV